MKFHYNKSTIPTKLHKMSNQIERVENEELDHQAAPVQTEILGRDTRVFRPVQAAPYHDSITFEVMNQQYGCYIDPANTILEVEVGIRKRDAHSSVLGKGKKVAPINIPLHSMFKNLTCSLSQQVINESNETHPYVAYNDTLLNSERDFLETQGELMLWEKDDEESLSNTAAEATKVTYAAPATTDEAKGVTAMPVESNALGRRQFRWFKNAPDPTTGAAVYTYHPITLMGRPIGPLFQQDRYLPFGVDMRIQLDKAKDEFVLMNGEAGEYEFRIEDIRLYVDYVKLSPEAFQANRTSDVTIPVTRTYGRFHNIPTGTTGKSFTLFSGQLPVRMVLGLVDGSSRLGDKEKNPFCFQDFGLNKLFVQKNGETFPFRPYEPDFAKKRYAREYMALFEAVGILNENAGVPITYDDFGDGFTLFCFNFTGEGKNGMGDETTQHIQNTGQITVDLGFKPGTTTSVDLFVYAEFENSITIDPRNNVDRGY